MEKRYLNWLVPGLVLIILAGLIIYEQRNKSLAGVSFDVNRVVINGTQNLVTPLNRGNGTSTMSVLPVNATTTFTFGINKAESVNLHYAYLSTTTAGALTWSYEYSYDNSNWYMEDLNSTTGSTVTHNQGTASTSPSLHQWYPVATGSVQFKDIVVTPTAEKYMRLNLTCSAACVWWGEAILKQPF